MTRRGGAGRRGFELALVAAALGLAVYIGARLLERRKAVNDAGRPPVGDRPLRAGGDVDPMNPDAAPAQPPKAGSVTRGPRYRLKTPPKPTKKPPVLVPAPADR